MKLIKEIWEEADSSAFLETNLGKHVTAYPHLEPGLAGSVQYFHGILSKEDGQWKVTEIKGTLKIEHVITFDEVVKARVSPTCVGFSVTGGNSDCFMHVR